MSRHSTPCGRPLRAEAGFTLVEMIVAVALFSVVMLISVSALLSLVDANRKAQALQSVINNLNIAVDGLVRSVREGSNYRCGGAAPSNPDCEGGGTVFFFEPFTGSSTDTSDDWAYSYDATTHRLYKSENGGINYIAITAPEVTIDSVTFYVIGARRGTLDSGTQPKVLVVIKGTAGAAKAKTRTTFHLQATAVQRVLDI